MMQTGYGYAFRRNRRAAGWMMAALLGLAILWAAGAGTPVKARSQTALPPVDDAPQVLAGSPVLAGRYIVAIAGCNDCHTDGWMETHGEVPEEKWLLGSRLGWRGPWGTTYPSNLRLFVQNYDEDTWVQVIRARKDRPPMPWMNLHYLSDADLRAVFQYIRSLGPAGDVMPEYVPPQDEPKTPYLLMSPIFPPGVEQPVN
jgi:mono/diheme cytochrome c family protein